MFSDKTHAFAEELTAMLLGLDAFYAAEQGKGEHGSGGDIERLVVLNMSTRHQPTTLLDFSDARARFEELRRLAQELPEPDRALYCAQVCSSAITLATWRESGLTFDRQISDFLEAPSSQPAYFDYVYGRMHSPQCIALFQA